MAFKSAAANRTVPSGRGVVKQASNQLPRSYYVNAAAIGMAALIAVLAVRGVVSGEDTHQCSERLGNGTLFGLQVAGGAPMSTGDLQARLAGRDWGLLDNLKITALKEGPAPVAMRVALPKLASKTDNDKQMRSGMGFTWLMPKLAAATSACLTYSIRLPADFNFGAGGALPGLFGGENNDAIAVAKAPSFAVRNAWGEEGLSRIRLMTTDNTKGIAIDVDPDGLRLERNRWLRIEQEVVLNQPGKDDGVLRVWVDGKLRLENTSMIFREDERTLFRGVLADVHYGENGQAVQAVPKSTSIEITPFEVRWQ